MNHSLFFSLALGCLSCGGGSPSADTAGTDVGTRDAIRVDTNARDAEVDSQPGDASCGDGCSSRLDAGPGCNDGIQNGDEEGVDCGGAACAPCADLALTSFATIAAESEEATFVFRTPAEYLGEYLRRRRDVCFFEVDAAAETIRALDAPACANTVMVAPTGGEDGAIIQEAAAMAGDGGCVDGGGAEFVIDGLQIGVAGVSLRNFRFVPLRAEGEALVSLSATNVSVLNVMIDFGGADYVSGFVVEDGAHNASIVGSGVSNMTVTRMRTAAGIRVRGSDAFYLACTTMENLTSEAGPIRGVWYTDADPTEGGVIANNRFVNFQSTNERNGSRVDDADAIVFQGLPNRQFESEYWVVGNFGEDMGKRFIKLQTGNVAVHGNDMNWKTGMGPLDARAHSEMYAVHGVSNARITNNFARVEAESAYLGFPLFIWNEAFDEGIDNVHIDQNIIDRSSAVSTIGADVAFNFVGPQNTATNVSMSRNLARGSGRFTFMYWFRESPSNGADIPHEDNVIMIEYGGLYRD